MPKNIKIKDYDIDIDVVSFGKGNKVLIMIPGLGDSFKTVKNMAFPLSFLYRKLSRDYKVFVISRRNYLPKDFTMKDMASDIVKVMDILSISKASVLGISQGGMIAQCIGIYFPKRVDKLILVVTSSRVNSLMEKRVNHWLDLANDNNYKDLFIDTAEKSYTEKFLKRLRKSYGLLWRISNPKSFERFFIQANACLQHNVYDELNKIIVPTLIIGAEKDKIVGVNASKEMAAKIKNSKIFIFEEYGHGVYEETKEFIPIVRDFLQKN